MLNFLNFRFYLLAFSIWPSASINAYYYCDKEELCGDNKHFLCNPDDVPKKGELLRLLPMTRKIKRLFVDRHNEYRNKLAGGEQTFKGGEKCPKATRMREIIWDDELAYIAGRHAERCYLMHDACRSTERFPRAIQNLHIFHLLVKPEKVTDKIVKAVDDWWSEYLMADYEDIIEKSPRRYYDWWGIIHFCTIADECAAFVGCGLALCQNCQDYYSVYPYCIMVTCNYSQACSAFGTFLYKYGNSSASECDHYESVPSSKYPHLCENTGKIFND